MLQTSDVQKCHLFRDKPELASKSSFKVTSLFSYLILHAVHILCTTVISYYGGTGFQLLHNSHLGSKLLQEGLCPPMQLWQNKLPHIHLTVSCGCVGVHEAAFNQSAGVLLSEILANQTTCMTYTFWKQRSIIWRRVQTFLSQPELTSPYSQDGV